MKLEVSSKLKLRQDLMLEFGQFFLLMFCKGNAESKLNLGRVLKLGLVKILKFKF